jgi:hypothetical protein
MCKFSLTVYIPFDACKRGLVVFAGFLFLLLVFIFLFSVVDVFLSVSLLLVFLKGMVYVIK